MTERAETYLPSRESFDGRLGAPGAEADALGLLGVRDALSGSGTARGPVEQVRAGLPTAAVGRLAKVLNVGQRELLAAAAIAPATLTRRRRAEASRLSPEESDRLFRIADCFAEAVRLFEGDAAAARAWLREPAPALGGRTPFELLASEVGATEVRRLIGRLEHGVYS